MSADQVAVFLQAVAADAGLAEQFDALQTVDAAVTLAAQLGYDVAAEELIAALTATEAGLSDSELSNAVGGTGPGFGDPATLTHPYICHTRPAGSR